MSNSNELHVKPLKLNREMVLGDNGPIPRHERKYSFKEKLRRGRWNPLALSKRIKERFQRAKLEVVKSKHFWKSVGKLGVDDILNVVQAFMRNEAIDILEGESVDIIPSFSFSPWIVGIIIVALILIKVL